MDTICLYIYCCIASKSLKDIEYKFRNGTIYGLWSQPSKHRLLSPLGRSVFPASGCGHVAPGWSWNDASRLIQL